MTADEPMTMAKWAVTIMLIVLVIVSATGLFFYLNDESLKFVRHMEKSSTGAELEKFVALETDSKAKDGILVTSVCNALSDTNDTSLVFVYIESAEEKMLYTYPNYNVNPADFPGVTIKTTDDMINLAIKGLMRYSSNKCDLTITYPDGAKNDLEGVNILIKQ